MVTVLFAVVTINVLASGLGTTLGPIGGDVIGLSSREIGLLLATGLPLQAWTRRTRTESGVSPSMQAGRRTRSAT